MKYPQDDQAGSPTISNEHRYPMNKPSAENNRCQLNKSVEANIQSYAGMGPKTTLKVKVKSHHIQSHLTSTHDAPNDQISDPSFNALKVIVRTSPFLADLDSFDHK